MSKFRFSLASLVGVVCAAGVVFGAWRYDANLGCGVVFMLTTFAVASATLADRLGSEATRWRWLPFAVFALVYGAGGWFQASELRPGYYLANLFSEHPNALWPGDPVCTASDALFSLLIGFIGMFVFHFYWKHHPPGGGAERPKRPE